jgi:hypothetical protein
MWLKASFDFFDTHTGGITAVASLVLTVITGVYVVLTKRIARTSKDSVAAAAQAAKASEKANEQALVLARIDVVHRMIDRFVHMLDTIEFKQSREPAKGAQALKALWVIGKNSAIWTGAQSNHFEGLCTAVRGFFDEHLSYKEHEIFGDFETLAYHYLSIFEFCAEKAGNETEELIEYLRKFHPREMAFLCFIICVVRKEKGTAQTMLKFKILERAISQNAMLPGHRDVLEKIAAG